MLTHHCRPLLSVLLFGSIVCAEPASAETPEELQKLLNEQVLGQSFSVEDSEKLEAYMSEAKKKGIAPVTTPSRFWRRGYTCADLRRYSWTDYRDCSYYYRYHGRYWPY